MDYNQAMERRVSVLEEALLGDTRPNGHPGLVETQRAQGRDIKEMKKGIADLTDKVDAVIKDRDDEILVRQGEQRMLRLFRNIIFALLGVFTASGSLLANRILTALKELNP